FILLRKFFCIIKSIIPNKDAEVAETRKYDEEITDATKVDSEKTEEVKGDNDQARIKVANVDQAKETSAQDNQATTLVTVKPKEMPELPSTSSSLSVSSSLSLTLLNVLVSVILEQPVRTPSPVLTTETPVSTVLLNHLSVTTITPIQQQTTPIPTPPITTVAPSVIIAIPNPLPTVIQRLYVLESQFKAWKQVDHSKAIEDSVQANIINEKILTFLAQSSFTPDQSASRADECLSELELKSIFFEKMDKRCSYLTHDKHQDLFNSLLNSIMLDEATKKGDANPDNVLRKRDRGDDEDEDHYARLNQGKKTKRRRTKESESSKKSSTLKDTSKVAKPTEEVIIEVEDNTTNDDVSPTPDLKWNKVKAVDDTQEQTWFNDLLSAEKDLLIFEELMATPIDFSKFSMNHLKIDKLTKPNLVGPFYKLLKGTCQSSIELEYNMEECYKALTDQLDWENLKGDRCPLDLSKPLPLEGHPGHLTIAAYYFFNNDLEYLKSTDSERKYTPLITKTKAVRYELVDIEDMIPKLWSVAKVGCDKDDKRRIKHWGHKHQLF
ncbi:hypothetical protein Tco_1453044, partial [Tanacetum coccineum]